MNPAPADSAPLQGIVFLVDVDNTLLDNDRVVADLHEHLEVAFGAASAGRYWAIFEALRTELGYADYLGALQRYRSADEGGTPDSRRLMAMAGFLIDYPFAERLYPRALEVLQRLGEFGTTVILTDGDVVFQPRKVQRSGLWDAVQGRVLVYVHKERMLDAVQCHYPARRYVVIDDKLRILATIKGLLRERVTTVFARQGHYALDAAGIAAYPPADITVGRIGDLADTDVASLIGMPH